MAALLFCIASAVLKCVTIASCNLACELFSTPLKIPPLFSLKAGG